MKIPPIVDPAQREAAKGALRCYFRLEGHDHNGHGRFTGARFNTWSSTGAPTPPDEFTADDVVAVTFLSVSVPGAAAIRLLQTEKARFSAMLIELGPDQDLVALTEPLADSWAGWKLMRGLRDLPGVGPVTASKLFARKRPKLRPIYDTVVAREIGSG